MRFDIEFSAIVCQFWMHFGSQSDQQIDRKNRRKNDLGKMRAQRDQRTPQGLAARGGTTHFRPRGGPILYRRVNPSPSRPFPPLTSFTSHYVPLRFITFDYVPLRSITFNYVQLRSLRSRISMRIRQPKYEITMSDFSVTLSSKDVSRPSRTSKNDTKTSLNEVQNNRLF